MREVTVLKGTIIQYLGFGTANGRREYVLDVRRNEETRRYKVSIDLAAFSRGQALLQDGPDISYQKLVRELADPERHATPGIEVTEADLLAYRESHAPPARRASFTNFARPSETTTDPESSTIGRGGKVA